MAYGFQYIPGTFGDRRDEQPLVAPWSGRPATATTRVFRLGPSTSAVTAAVESLYRDIEELRRSAVDAQDALDPLRARSTSA